MDLTKIVLPTFILERRSLLEMYADFFAHPDIFTEISEKENPEQRIIQVLKWYLSAFRLVSVICFKYLVLYLKNIFSASRKTTVAKKPYNPILGRNDNGDKCALKVINLTRRDIPVLVSHTSTTTNHILQSQLPAAHTLVSGD